MQHVHGREIEKGGTRAYKATPNANFRAKRCHDGQVATTRGRLGWGVETCEGCVVVNRVHFTPPSERNRSWDWGGVSGLL